MALAASEIAVKGKPNASDTNVTDALRRHVPQSTTLEKWDRNYLVFIPPPYNVRSLTSKTSAIRQELDLLESSPVLYLVQGGSGKAPPPGDARLRRLAAMRIVTKRAIAKLAAAADAPRIRTSTGALSAEPVGTDGWWLFTYETPGDALDAAYWMTETAKLPATPDFERLRFKRMTPDDTLYFNQWHLNSPFYGINVTTAWDTRQGTGRHIAVLDDGVQLTHPDLSANTYSVASDNNYDFNGDDNDPSPVFADDSHGTATAGLALGRGNNSLGITGVAFMSKLLGIRLLGGPVSDFEEEQAFTWKPSLTDVSSNSWGPIDDGATIDGPGPLGTAGLESAVMNGRGGRGVVFVFSGGNGGAWDDSNYDGYANSRFAIGVGATNNTGGVWSGSESGANIALVAPGFQLTTTDRTGAEGYDPTDYTSTATFTGTSGAAPLVAGAAALLIEANPNLGYRDVKEILMRSANRANLNTSDPFIANAAGIPFSRGAGAGLLDVGNALAMAATWTNLAAETSISSTQSPSILTIPDNYPIGVTRFFDMSSLPRLRVETVELTVSISHPNRGDLEFEITAPSGMRSIIRRRALDVHADYTDLMFTSVRHWGESSSGTWSVKVADVVQGSIGFLNSVNLRIWGTSTGSGPDLTIAKTHTGNFNQGQIGAMYTINVANFGSVASTGTVTVTETLPAGLTATGIAGTGWTCTAPSGPCSRSNALAPGASYPPIMVTVNVAVDAPASVINTATVSGGGDLNPANNTAPDVTAILTAPDLLITSFTAPNASPTGVQINVSTTIVNQGRSTGSTIRVDFYFSSTPTISTNSVPQSNSCFVAGLEAGASRMCNTLVNVPPGIGSGTWYLGAIVDQNNEIPELNENNNSRAADSGLIVITGAPGLRFVPVTPCRVLDTRLAAGPFGGPAIGGGGTRNVAIPQSACGIPANASSYSLNVTVVPANTLSYLTMWPAGNSQPFVSTLNSLDGRIKANAAIVPAGVNGSVSVYATHTTHVILDINGYFIPPTGQNNLVFYPVTPCRISDTRLPAGPFGGPSMTAGQTRSFAIPNAACSIPPTAQAYSLNMTVAPSGPLSYLTTWPAGQPQPFVSTLNSPTGAVAANAAIVPAGANGAISVYVTNPTDVIIDINGYFAPPGSPGELLFYSMYPCRISDTRNAVGPLGGPALSAGQSRTLSITANSCGLPFTAKAFSLNATVVPSGPLIYLTLWPTGQAQPVVSTLNSFDATIVSNAAIVPAGTNGSVTTFVSNPTDLIVDTNGYFAP